MTFLPWQICPECGARDVCTREESVGRLRAFCKSCAKEGPISIAPMMAIHAWNKAVKARKATP